MKTNIFKLLFKLIFIILLIIVIALNSAISKQPADRQALNETFLPIVTAEDSAKSIKSLDKDIKRILKNKGLRKTTYSIGIYSLTNNKFLFADNLDQPLTPASTTKLFTSFTALNIFGKDYQVPTKVFTDGEVTQDSVLKGNIFLYGYGDCLLKVSDVENLADQIKHLGIKSITGNVYGDGSYFDGITNRQKYSGDKDKVQTLGPITALGINRNQVTVLITSGSKAGAKLNVQLIPNSETFSKIVTGVVKSRGKSRRKRRKKKSRGSNELYYKHDFTSVRSSTPRLNAGDAPPEPLPVPRRKSTVRISSSRSKSGKQQIKVSGYLYPNRSRSYRYYLINPVLTVAGVLKDRLIAGGVEVDGKALEGRMDELADSSKLRVIAEVGRPITELIYEQNKQSNNFIAEHLMKAIGAYTKESELNLESYRKSLFKVLEKHYISCQGCSINDGSGLSRRNLVTASALIRILVTSYESPYGSALDSSFSIAGVDGTLKKRMIATVAAGNLRGKTGTLRNVSSLAGYANTLDGELLAFAFIFNGNDPGLYKQIENAICETAAQFFYFNEEY